MKKGEGKKAKEKQRETLKNKQKMPFSRGKTVFLLETKKGKEKKIKQQTNMEGLVPSEVPFGPPHVTLKPSKTKNPQKTQKTTKKKQKANKEGLGPSEVALRATSPDHLS